MYIYNILVFNRNSVYIYINNGNNANTYFKRVAGIWWDSHFTDFMVVGTAYVEIPSGKLR